MAKGDIQQRIQSGLIPHQSFIGPSPEILSRLMHLKMAPIPKGNSPVRQLNHPIGTNKKILSRLQML